MPSKMPPVPEDNRSKEGPGGSPAVNRDDPKPQPRENFAEQGRHGNIKQNTTNRAHQQDR